MANARKRLKGHQDFMSSRTYRRKPEREDTRRTLANRDKLFDNMPAELLRSKLKTCDKYVAPDRTLQ